MKKERRPRSLARAVLVVVLVAMLALLVLPAVASAANSPTIDIVYQNYVVNNSDYLGWIFGSGFQPGCKVYIGQYGGASYAASKVQFNSSGFLVVTVPMKNAQPGNYNVYVANPDGKWAWKLNSFSVHAAPTIDLVYTNTVKNNSDYMGWIFGSNYVSGCQAVLQKQGAPSVVYFSNYMQYNGEGFLVVGFPTKGAQVGTYDVIVRNPDLGEVKKLGAFRITAP